ncbi:MAG: hypothetical protein R2865_00245 [Deinococcales bacterium]
MNTAEKERRLLAAYNQHKASLDDPKYAFTDGFAVDVSAPDFLAFLNPTLRRSFGHD